MCVRVCALSPSHHQDDAEDEDGGDGQEEEEGGAKAGPAEMHGRVEPVEERRALQEAL